MWKILFYMYKVALKISSCFNYVRSIFNNINTYCGKYNIEIILADSCKNITYQVFACVEAVDLVYKVL